MIAVGLCLALVLSFAMVGCTNKDKNNGSSSSSAPITTTTTTTTTSGNTTSEPTTSGTTTGNGTDSGAITSTPESQEPSAPALQSDLAGLANLPTKAQGWGQGVEVNDKNQPTGSIMFQEKYGKYNAYYIAPDEGNHIYLTFDEGYENGYTSQILDVLKEKKCSAVFFVTYDYVSKNADLVKRMIDEGHVVGNHSYTHPHFPETSLEKAQEDIVKLHDYVKENFGYTMTLFRFPYGEFSEQMLGLLDSLGYKTLFWSWAYKDWDVNNQPDTASAYEKICKGEHPGAIYLLHAVSKTNTAILGDVIDHMRQSGYNVAKFAL
ncbi:polysaccharide deacetylase family protein [Oscillospiraceae bacterium NSJ-54]|uniref:Polysaccharide deacetylase family protein n=2 Tax=Zongyangia hominis TaxID=2763677 RepID=A0A926EC30_9FIRM|nr:polysaccharide deacetylase family protein [Zongyangia hominis]